MKKKRARVLQILLISALLATNAAVCLAGEPPRTKDAPRFTPEERQRRQQQIRERLARQIGELKKKKANGQLNDEERRKLERLELLANRDRRRGSNAPAGSVLASPEKSGKKSPN